MNSECRDVVIVGGGITGLAAAFYLEREARRHRQPAAVSLLEASSRLGGKIHTLVEHGMVAELGPDSFMAGDRAALEFVAELGRAQDLVASVPGALQVFRDGHMYSVPPGLRAGVPTDLGEFLRSELLSAHGKWRALRDLLPGWHRLHSDCSLGEFLRARFGEELVERLMEPFFSAIYAGDIRRLSLQATLPQIYRLAQRGHSLMRGMRVPQQGHGRLQTRIPKLAGGGPFVTLRPGLQSLADAVEDCLPAHSIERGAAVRRILRAGPGYRIELESGATLAARAVILALAAPVAARLLGLAPEFELRLGTPATSVATLVVAFPGRVAGAATGATGFVVASGSTRHLSAGTWLHRKWPHSVHSGASVLRCALGHGVTDAFLQQPDDALLQAALDDLKPIVHFDGPPTFSRVARWPAAMPQYSVGHVLQVAALRQLVTARFPEVILAGASYDGLSLGSCVRQGRAAAQAALRCIAPDTLPHAPATVRAASFGFARTEAGP